MNQDVTQPAQKGRSQRQKLVLAKFSSDSVTPVTDTELTLTLFPWVSLIFCKAEVLTVLILRNLIIFVSSI